MADLRRTPIPSPGSAAPIDVPPLSPTAVPAASPVRSRRSSQSSSSAHTPGTELATSPLGGVGGNALPSAVTTAKAPPGGDEVGFASLAAFPPPTGNRSPGRLHLTLTLPSPRPSLGRAQSSNAVVTPTQGPAAAARTATYMPLPPPTCTDSANCATATEAIATRRRSSPRTTSDPLPPRPVISTSVSYSAAGPSTGGNTLQSTPTAELGPFEYPVPDPESKAGKRAALSPSVLPNSTDHSPLNGGRQTDSYFSPPRLSLSLSADDKAAVAEAAAAAAAAAAAGTSPSPSSPVLGTSPKRITGPPASMRPRAATTSRTRSGSVSHSRAVAAAALSSALHHAHSGHAAHTHHTHAPGSSSRIAHRHGSIAFPVTPVPAPIPPSLLARSSNGSCNTSAGAVGTSAEDSATGSTAGTAAGANGTDASRPSSYNEPKRPGCPGSRKSSQ